MSTPVRYGLMSGFLSMFFLTLLYVVDKNLMVSPWHQVAWLILIVAMYLAAFQERKNQGGYIHQKDALRAAFVVFLLGSALVAMYDYLMPAFFDPTLVDLAKANELRLFDAEQGRMTTDEFYTRRREIELRQGGPGFFNSLFIYIFFTIFGFLAAGIISFVVRRMPVRRDP